MQREWKSVCVCVCVREREREGERERKSEREITSKRVKRREGRRKEKGG